MSKFKVGDKVKVRPGCIWVKTYTSIGEVIRLKEEGGKYLRVKFTSYESFPLLEKEIVLAEHEGNGKEVIKQLYREIHALEAEVFEMFMETQ